MEFLFRRANIYEVYSTKQHTLPYKIYHRVYEQKYIILDRRTPVPLPAYRIEDTHSFTYSYRLQRTLVTAYMFM